MAEWKKHSWADTEKIFHSFCLKFSVKLLTYSVHVLFLMLIYLLFVLLYIED